MTLFNLRKKQKAGWRAAAAVALSCMLTLEPSLALARITGTLPTNPDAACWGPDGAEACIDSSGNAVPTTDNDAALGTSSLRWSDVQALDGTFGDDLTVTDDMTVNGDLTAGSAADDVFDLNAGTVTVPAIAQGVFIATHTGSVGASSQGLMTLDGANRRVCIGCDGNQAPSDGLQILDDGLRLGTGSTPSQAVDEDDAFIEGTLEVDGGIHVPMPAAETIGAAGTITADACGGIKRITAASAVTTNTTNTFTAPAAGNEGCGMDVVNVGANAITLDNNANFFSAGAADVVLGSSDTVRVISTGASGFWYQVGDTGNN